jgi:hypothetical protein
MAADRIITRCATPSFRPIDLGISGDSQSPRHDRQRATTTSASTAISSASTTASETINGAIWARAIEWPASHRRQVIGDHVMPNRAEANSAIVRQIARAVQPRTVNGRLKRGIGGYLRWVDSDHEACASSIERPHREISHPLVMAPCASSACAPSPPPRCPQHP